MKISDGVVHVTAGLFTPIATGFVFHSIEQMIPWMMAMFMVILADLAFGIRKSKKLGVDISWSRAFRETMGKMVTYFAWVVAACMVDVAAGWHGGGTKWACLLVMAVEGGSVVGNLLKPYGIELSLKELLKLVLKKSPLQVTDDEAESVVREEKKRQIRKREQEKWKR